MGDEIELVSDGDGVVISGQAAAVERFLTEHDWLGNPREYRPGSLSTWLRTAGDLAISAGQVAEHSTRYLKLTPESAQKLKDAGGLMATKKDGISYAMLGKPGDVSSWLQVEDGAAALLTNPAVLAGLGGLMSQFAQQAEAQELKALLVRMDEKLDDLRRAQRDQVLAKLERAAEAIKEAMTIRAHGGDPETLWDKVQGESSAIHEVQRYTLRALGALADKVEGKTKTGELKKVAREIEGDIGLQLSILARCFELQDEFRVVELDHVHATAPKMLAGHRQGVEAARQQRRDDVLERTSRIMGRLDAAGEVAAANVLLHARSARSIVGSLNRTAETIDDFHAPLGVTLDREEVLLKAWTEALRDRDQLKTAGIEVGQKASMAGTAAIGIGVMAVAASKNREK
jgi:hypothetical protein